MDGKAMSKSDSSKRGFQGVITHRAGAWKAQQGSFSDAERALLPAELSTCKTLCTSIFSSAAEAARAADRCVGARV